MKRLISLLLAILMILPILASCEDFTVTLDANLDVPSTTEATTTPDSAKAENDNSNGGGGTEDCVVDIPTTPIIPPPIDNNPDTVDPGTTDTDTGSGEPDENKPENVEPGSTDTGSNEPDENEPDNVEPGSTDTGSGEPDENEPDNVEPGSTDTGSNEPNGNEPEENEPDNVEPGSTDTGSGEPEGDGFQAVVPFYAYTYVTTSIFKEAKISSSTLKIVNASTALTVIAKKEIQSFVWYKVMDGEVEGYVPQDFVSKNKNDTIFTDLDVADQKTITVKGDALINFREYPVISELINQDVITLDYSKTSNGELKKIGENKSGTWYKVSYEGSIYYLSASSTTLSYLLIKDIESTTPEGPVPDDSNMDIDSSIFDDMTIEELLQPDNFQGADIQENVDFGGYEFNMLVDTTNFNKEFVAESDGYLIKDALVNRQEWIEEYVGIDFVFTETLGGYNNMEGFATEIETANQAGKPYDLALAYNLIPSVVAAKGLSKDLAESTTLNLLNTEKEYWSEDFINEVKVNGRIFWATDISSWNTLRNMLCIFVNTDFFELHNEGKTKADLYAMVDNKTWTMENMMTLIQGAYEDTKDNNVIDDGDTFGLEACVSNPWLDTWFYAAGFRYTKKMSDGNYEWVFNNSNATEFDFIAWWLEQLKDDDVHVNLLNAGEATSIFQEGRTMFALAAVNMVEGDPEIDYTVLPMPMYKASVKDGYSTPLSNYYSAYLIPKACPSQQFERSATVLELLAAEGHRRLAPTYFEIYLKRQISVDDPDMQRMFNVIRNSIVFDFGYLYGSSLKAEQLSGNGTVLEVQVFLRQTWQGKSGYEDFENVWEQIGPGVTNKLNDLMADLVEY